MMTPVKLTIGGVMGKVSFASSARGATLRHSSDVVALYDESGYDELTVDSLGRGQ